jgi:nicotinamidase-related amidase
MLARIVFAFVVVRSFASTAECGQDGLCDDTSLVQVKHSITHRGNPPSNIPKVTCRDPNNCKVYFVIDVQNGYDHDWLSETNNLPSEEFNCGWNNGLDLPDKFFEEINEELEKDDEWDFFVYTQDWLPGEITNRRGWKFKDYLTITAGNPGADINGRVKYSSFLNENGDKCREAFGCTDPKSKKRFLLHTKSIDDSMSSDLSREDLGPDGNPKPEGEGMSLPDKLTQLGLTKEKTTIVAAGLVTERCVKAAALTAKSLGYKKVMVDPWATQSSSLGVDTRVVPPADLEDETDGTIIYDSDRSATLKMMQLKGIGFWKSNKGEQSWHKTQLKFHMIGHSIAIQHEHDAKAKTNKDTTNDETDGSLKALASLGASAASKTASASEDDET